MLKDVKLVFIFYFVFVIFFDLILLFLVKVSVVVRFFYKVLLGVFFEEWFRFLLCVEKVEFKFVFVLFMVVYCCYYMYMFKVVDLNYVFF